MSKAKLFLQLAKVDETNISEYIDTDTFIDEYSSLKFTNGGDWCRADSVLCSQYNIITIKNNKKLRILYPISDLDLIKLKEDIENKSKNSELIFIKNNNGIKYIKICGKRDGISINRRIRKDIIDYYKYKKCVHCGTSHNIEIDHKNGLYNDSRVLNLKTQNLDDFQPLCRHCNQIKRQSIIKMKNSNKRQSIKEIPIFENCKIDFTEGDESFDITEPNTLIGTYWYDPIDFVKKIYKVN